MNIFDIIKKYPKVCIYRHVNSDFDALGSQYGLAFMIRQLYPEIKIMIKGEYNNELMSKLNVKDTFDDFDDLSNTLAIVLDTANKERIDGDDYEKCDFILKIDHHIIVDSYGNENIELPSKSSTSQIVTELYADYQKELLNKQAATCLYFGIIADSNRFMYRNTDASTLKSAAYLLECGIDIEDIYQRLYLRKEIDLKINRYILNNYRSSGSGVAYYILNQFDLEELGISRQRGSDFVNMLANIEEFEVWMAVTENVEAKNWRVSIRSRQVVVNEIAAKFGGGGHQLASGATLNSLEELDLLIEELEKAIKEYHS